MNSIGWGQCTTPGSGTCTAATSVSGTTTWSGYYCVNSDITISGNLTIASGSDLQFNGFYKITVSGTLTINNTDIYGATQMWNRITVQPGGTLTISGSRIQDGTVAVNAENGTGESFISLNGNTFCNNKTAVRLNAINTAATLSTVIADNEISAPSLKTPLSGQLGDFGIYVDQVNHTTSGSYALFIGDGTPYSVSTTFNYIHDVNIGIRSYGSDIILQDNLLQNMTSGTAATLPSLDAVFANTAIAASSVITSIAWILTGTTVSSLVNNEIQNCTNGIQIKDYCHPIIRSNKITGNNVGSSYSMNRGIYINDNIDIVEITGNTIQKFSGEAIYLDNLQVQGAKTITNNVISTVSGFTSIMNPYGVRVRELVLGSGYVLTISGNTVGQVRNGVHVINISRPTISNNTINFNSTGGSSNSNGIRTINCPNTLISGNTTIGDCLTGNCSGNVRPIMVEGCGAFVLDNNYTQYGSAGIWIQDNSVLGNLYCNQIRNSFKGIMLYNLGTTGSVIGPVQSPLGGPSDNGWYPAATQNRVHAYPFTDASTSKWRYRNSDAWYDIPTTLLTSGPPPSVHPFYELVTGSYCDLPSMKLDGDDAEFLTNKYGDWAVEYIADDAAFSATSYYYSWLFWNDVQADESLMEGATDEILAAYDAINASNIPGFYNVMAAIAERNFSEAAEINEGISAANDIESYWQLTNAIYIRSVDDNGLLALSDEDAENLSDIINLNPQQYGFGVYNAWGMLDTVVNYNMEWEEERIAYTDEEKLSFYPNPASSFIIFSANLKDLDIINIYSPEGKLLLQQKVEEKYKLDISSLSSGMYIITILHYGDVKLTDKLFIMKPGN